MAVGKYLVVDSAGKASAGIRGREVIAVLWKRPFRQGRGDGELADVRQCEVGGVDRQWWWRRGDVSA
jgi:hypothetical protein